VTAPSLSCRDVVRFEKRISQNCEFYNDDKVWEWAAGRRRRNLAWIWISQHLNGTSRKRCPCAKWPLEQVWFTKSALLNVAEMLRNRWEIFCPYSSRILLLLRTALSNNKMKRGLHPPKNGVIALWPNTRVVKCKYYVSQKQNGFNNKFHWYSILLTFIFKFTARLLRTKIYVLSNLSNWQFTTWQY